MKDIRTELVARGAGYVGGEYPEKALSFTVPCSKSGSNHAEKKNFGKFRVAGVIKSGSLWV